MKNKLMTMGIGLLVMATPILAQGGPVDATTPSEATRKAAAYLSVGIASGLCGLGQGRAVASAAEAMARNPGAIAAIRVSLLIGLAFIESLGLYALMVTYIAR
jgi:F-type H+-transporting ATPase subunit c